MLKRLAVVLVLLAPRLQAQVTPSAQAAPQSTQPRPGPGPALTEPSSAVTGPGIAMTGPIQASRINFYQAGTEKTDYPQQAPYVFGQGTEGRIGYGDNVLTVQVNTIVGSAFETALLRSTGGNNTNLQAESVRVETHGPIQIGGARSTVVDHNGTDDLVVETTIANGTGSDRGDNEGLERHRDFYGFQNGRFGGVATMLGHDAAGHARMRVEPVSQYDLQVVAGGRWLIDVSRRIAPAGAVTSVGRYSDPRFALVTVDRTLAAALRRQMGEASVMTVLKAGADDRRYDGRCPATQVGTWEKVDPYNADWAGEGARTRAQCLTVGSTAGLSAGMAVGLWGSQNNAEITVVTRVVDGTHVVVPLNHPHEPGELVTGGAGVGWSVGSPRSEYPAGFLPDAASRQAMTQHAAYPIVAMGEGTVILYTNSGATQDHAELHLNLFQSNAPRGGLHFRPTVREGTVVALNWTGGNAAGGDYSTMASWVPGVLPVLPPPVLRVSPRCAVDPKIALVQTTASQYQPRLISGGSGCAATVAITAQAVYPNPIVLYPVTKIYRTEDPASACTIHDVRMPHCPTSGYLLTDVLATEWHSGDAVEQVPGWNQLSGSQENIVESPDTMRSGQIGPGEVRKVWYPQSGQAMSYVVNETPSAVYFGRKEDGYARSGSDDATRALDAQSVPPIVTEYGNTWSGGQLFDVPPMDGEGTDVGGWITMVVCKTTAFSGGQQDLPCARGIRPDYDIFVHDMREVGGAYLRLTVSDADKCLKINGRCIVTK